MRFVHPLHAFLGKAAGCRRRGLSVIIQQSVVLAPKSRGFHLVTSEIVSQLPDLVQINQGLAHLFVKHTSASITVNENADPVSYTHLTLPTKQMV